MKGGTASTRQIHKCAAATPKLVRPRAAPTQAAGHPVILMDGVWGDFSCLCPSLCWVHPALARSGGAVSRTGQDKVPGYHGVAGDEGG